MECATDIFITDFKLTLPPCVCHGNKFEKKLLLLKQREQILVGDSAEIINTLTVRRFSVEFMDVMDEESGNLQLFVLKLTSKNLGKFSIFLAWLKFFQNSVTTENKLTGN